MPIASTLVERRRFRTTECQPETVVTQAWSEPPRFLLSDSQGRARIKMADKVEARIPAGMRDILPEQMLKRQYVLDVVRTVFEEFGFDPLQTSAT